ncbi:von Willebrand factor A domain-containing protein 5A-like [Caretta caretta]|uniref:von Willebrand factor A domain-containing protein 5A-like n=1 Tax=Caretta caretta TaxID=8467 RepID=UPI003F4C3CF7
MMSCGLLTSSKEPGESGLRGAMRGRVAPWLTRLLPPVPMAGSVADIPLPPVPLHRILVSVLIRGFVVEAGCQLLHRNEEPGPVEAVFKFPVDAEALSMPSRPGCGGPISRKRDRCWGAQELYGDALAGGQSLFLLQQEEAGGHVFSCSLGNLPPGEEAMLTLSYTYELLLEHDGAARYVLPTVLRPRYRPTVRPTDPPAASLHALQ